MARLTIFITNSRSGAFYEISKGWVNAFRLLGHNVIHWDGDPNVWYQHNPDIHIGCSGWPYPIPRPHKARVAIHVNPYCDQTIQVPNGPIINENQKAINWTVAQKPDFVFGYSLQDDMERLWLKWKNHGLKIIGMPNAADATIYQTIQPDSSLVYDCAWVGGYWGYKAINLDKYLVPVMKKFKSAWYGWSGPQGLWKGQASQEQVVKLFNSAKICPCVVEPHTTVYGIDIPERLFKVAACGALAISDPVFGIDRYFSSDILPTAKDPKHYMELCEMYINMSEKDRKDQAYKLQKEVLTNHTYYNRVQTFLEAFGINN